MSLPAIALTVSAFAVAVMIWRYFAAKPDDRSDEGRLGLRGHRLVSAEQICRQAAARLKLDVIYLERVDATLHPIAGVPWPAHLEILDTMAAEACLDSGEPAGIGSGQHGGSDWLFIPLQRSGQTVATVGVAGPHCRRRFDSDDAGILSLRRNFERYLTERSVNSEQDLAATLPLSDVESRTNAA